MIADTYGRERRRLAERLRTLRQETGLTGVQLAERLGWAQPKVSKIETGKQMPSEEDVRAWVRSLGCSDAALTDLLALLGGTKAEYAGFRRQYWAAGGAAAKQRDLLTLEGQAARIAEFQPAIIPGLLQTAEYARELLELPCGPALHGASQSDIAEMVAVRMDRQRILYSPGKRIQVVLLEAALYSRVCSPGTLLGQLDRLSAILGLPSLSLGIIPFTAQIPVFPLSGFSIYEQQLVVVETITGEEQLSEPWEVQTYDRLFDSLGPAAVFGAECAAIIRRAGGGLIERNPL